ncbi:uncharacterized protein [Miscanthus floridulus]|uniref:uncharacterized protein isoform X1 n=1 Tax=Miscanthus floridulus TaxID=154761 RepID=UPI003459F425
MLMLPYLETHHHQEQLRTSTSCWTYKLLTSHLHQDSTLRKTPPKQTAVIPATIAGSSALAHDNVPKRLFGDTLLGNQVFNNCPHICMCHQQYTHSDPLLPTSQMPLLSVYLTYASGLHIYSIIFRMTSGGEDGHNSTESNGKKQKTGVVFKPAAKIDTPEAPRTSDSKQTHRNKTPKGA